jgi:hypothetical protein
MREFVVYLSECLFCVGRGNGANFMADEREKIVIRRCEFVSLFQSETVIDFPRNPVFDRCLRLYRPTGLANNRRLFGVREEKKNSDKTHRLEYGWLASVHLFIRMQDADPHEQLLLLQPRVCGRTNG